MQMIEVTIKITDAEAHELARYVDRANMMADIGFSRWKISDTIADRVIKAVIKLGRKIKEQQK